MPKTNELTLNIKEDLTKSKSGGPIGEQVRPEPVLSEEKRRYRKQVLEMELNDVFSRSETVTDDNKDFLRKSFRQKFQGINNYEIETEGNGLSESEMEDAYIRHAKKVAAEQIAQQLRLNDIMTVSGNLKNTLNNLQAWLKKHSLATDGVNSLIAEIQRIVKRDTHVSKKKADIDAAAINWYNNCDPKPDTIPWFTQDDNVVKTKGINPDTGETTSSLVQIDKLLNEISGKLADAAFFRPFASTLRDNSELADERRRHPNEEKEMRKQIIDDLLQIIKSVDDSERREKLIVKAKMFYLYN